MEPRQGGPVDARGELHRVLLVEGLRQGRDHHLGGAADRLPERRGRPPRVRAPRLPARRRVQLVHLQPHPGALPLRPRRAARPVSRGQAAARRPGRGLGFDRAGRGEGAGLQEGPGQGRPGPRVVGRGRRDHRRSPRLHRQAMGARPDRRVLADPGHVTGLLRLGLALPRAHRRPDAVVLRLVRRPAQRLAADVRRPDGRPGVGRLVGRGLPDDVGLQRPDHPYAGRALDDRGALPRPEGRRGRARLRREREVRRRVGQPRRPAPTAPSRWGWGTSSSRSSSSTPPRPSSPTTPSSSPTCRTWCAWSPPRTGRTAPASSSSRGTWAGRARTPCGSPRSSTPAPARCGSRTARSGTASATRAWGGGTSSWATSTRHSACTATTRAAPARPSRSSCRASTRPTARSSTSGAASRSPGSATASSRPCSTCCSPSTAWRARACRASGRAPTSRTRTATTTPPCRPPRRGRSSTPVSRRARSPAWRGSGRRTPSTPRAAG